MTGGPYTRERPIESMLDSIPNKRAITQAGLLDEMRAYASYCRLWRKA